jgi:hypothetical protein
MSIWIAGTGLSGSTLFLELFKRLGYSYSPIVTFPNGVVEKETEEWEVLKGGTIYRAVRTANVKIQWPDVVKHLGGLCYNAPYWAEKFDYKVEHVFYSTRTMNESIARMQSSPRHWRMFGKSREGWDSMPKLEQENLVKAQFREQLSTCAYDCMQLDFPFSLVLYPKFAEDVNYCYKIVEPVLKPGIGFKEFNDVWSSLVDKNKITYRCK